MNTRVGIKPRIHRERIVRTVHGRPRSALHWPPVLLERSPHLGHLHAPLRVEIYPLPEGIPPQGGLHAGVDGLEDDRLLFELNLRLGRMDVDIHRLRIHLQPDEVGGGVSFRKIFFVGLHHRLVQIGAAEIASVHEEILVRDRLAGGVRAREESAHAHYGGVGVDVDQIPGDIRSHKVQHSEFQGLGRTEAEDVAPVRVEREA